MKRAMVVVIDRLGAGYLGPYGNTWIETPGFNRLAAESALFEFAFSDSPDLATAYRSWWCGGHALADRPAGASLPQRASAAGIPTALITDATEVAGLSSAAEFRERLLIPTAEAVRAADALEQTQLARLLGAATDWLEGNSRPGLLWVHSRGLDGPWDAPWEYREQFADEEDPTPPDFVSPPSRWVEPDEDPDLLLGIQQAYAGQVRLLDDCLAGLLAVCRELPPEQQPLLILTSPRGYPLGEHRRIGALDGAVYGEQLQVPCLVRYPDGRAATRRLHDLVQPGHVHATLEHWLELPAAGQPTWCESLTALLEAQPGEAASDRAAAVSGRFRALRTPAWFLHCGPERRELFVKPDDRWEANEISDRCRDIVLQLEAVLDEFQRAVQAGDRQGLSPLPAELRTAPR